VLCEELKREITIRMLERAVVPVALERDEGLSTSRSGQQRHVSLRFELPPAISTVFSSTYRGQDVTAPAVSKSPYSGK